MHNVSKASRHDEVGHLRAAGRRTSTWTCLSLMGGKISDNSSTGDNESSSFNVVVLTCSSNMARLELLKGIETFKSNRKIVISMWHAATEQNVPTFQSVRASASMSPNSWLFRVLIASFKSPTVSDAEMLTGKGAVEFESMTQQNSVI